MKVVEPGGTGSIAQGMAAAPLSTPRVGSDNPILAFLGKPTIMPGNGMTYPRMEGFGAKRAKHPDGGTNETAAMFVWKPFKGLDIEMEARIYCERWQADGRPQVKYNVTLPKGFQFGRRDADAAKLAQQTKREMWSLYCAYLKTDGAKVSAKTAKDLGGDEFVIDTDDNQG